MQNIKKYFMTLVALFAISTGAWAAESKPIGLNVEYAAGDEITSTTDVYVYYGEHPTNHKKMGVKITSTQPLKISMIIHDYIKLNGDAAVYYLPSGESTGGLGGGISCVGESTGDATVVHVASGSGTLTDPYVFGSGPSGTPVPLTRGTGEKINEWTLTNGMPAGNVTVSVEYFPQATAADGAVTAATDAKATTDAPLVTVDATQLTGAAKMMYYASTEATAPDYDAEGWSDKVPTAEKFTEAGNVNVWYYPVGTDEGVGGATATYSDGDMNATALAVSLGAAPTYDVEFAEDNPEPDKWSASPNTDVKKGTEVTVTYTGERKVIGVKAEKKKILVTKITLSESGSTTKTHGDSGTLSVTSVLPEDATDKTYTWSSDDPYGVSIDQNGNWRVVGRSGFVTLRATANDGSGVSASLIITIR